MGDTLNTLLLLCGAGLFGCLALFIGTVFFMLFTGRWLMIPTLFSIVPQTFRFLFGQAGVFRGGGRSINQGRGRSSRYDEDSDGDFERRGGRGGSAADRIFAKRERFSGTPDGRSLRPSAGADDADDDDSLRPQRQPWQQGGRRGGVSGKYDVRGPSRAHKPDSDGDDRIGNRPRRDSRKREWNEDEIFGGMGEE
ncbi:MAG: hypothetical protein EA396_07765 [Anaerolineaceae bacterium]|nr:MAG: hypothetical protein EA396_07765 [Anaerolineaceae bacterium]